MHFLTLKSLTIFWAYVEDSLIDANCAVQWLSPRFIFILVEMWPYLTSDISVPRSPQDWTLPRELFLPLTIGCSWAPGTMNCICCANMAAAVFCWIRLLRPLISSCVFKCGGGWRYLQFSRVHRPWGVCEKKKSRSSEAEFPGDQDKMDYSAPRGRMECVPRLLCILCKILAQKIRDRMQWFLNFLKCNIFNKN